MGVVLGERDIRREIMKHRGRSEKFLMKACNSSCQVPISGGNVWRRSCQCTSDCGYFLPLLTSSCWKAHKWLLQNEGHNFSYFPFATAFLFFFLQLVSGQRVEQSIWSLLYQHRRAELSEEVLTEISIPYPSTYSFWAFKPVYTLQKHLSQSVSVCDILW